VSRQKLPTPSVEQVQQLALGHHATIPEDYLDDMGHMNVMWYTYLYSRSIRTLLESLGLNHQYIEHQQCGTFALEKHLRYLSEVRVGEQVSVYTRVVGCNGVRFHLIQFLVNDTRGRVASTMETVSAHVDLRERRSTPMPPPIAKSFAELQQKHDALSWPSPLCGVMGV
jgi:acyl-CoA thioester hydrolase